MNKETVDGRELLETLQVEATKGNICFLDMFGNLIKVNLDEFMKQPVGGIRH